MELMFNDEFNHRATVVIQDNEGIECCGFFWCRDDKCRKFYKVEDGHLFRQYSDSGHKKWAHCCYPNNCGGY